MNIILISCFKRTVVYDFYIHLGTRVPQGWNTPLIGYTLACCTKGACIICFKGKLPHAPLKKTAQV